MWTPQGRVKSVHISEPSTVVDRDPVLQTPGLYRKNKWSGRKVSIKEECPHRRSVHKGELYCIMIFKVVLEGSPRCPDNHDLSKCHRLYDLGRHIEQSSPSYYGGPCVKLIIWPFNYSIGKYLKDLE